MNDKSHFDALVSSLYEASLDPAAWSNSLPEIARQCQADNIHLLVWDPAQPNPLFSLAPGMNEDMEMSYRAYYGAIDPRRLLASQLPIGNWMACNQHFDGRTVDRSEFFQDYLIPGGCRYLLGTHLVRYGNLDVFVGMHRAPGRKPFSAAEIDFTKRITGHFQRAARLWLGTEELRQRAAIGEHAMDSVELGVIATDVSGKVRYANRYADALLRKGRLLRSNRGRLAATEPQDAKRFQAALQDAATTGQGQSLSLGSNERIGRSGYQVAVLPIGSTGPLAGYTTTGKLLVLISNARHRRTPTVQQLMSIFGLSPAEARLTRSLGAGESMDSYAKTNNLSVNTVKTQLKSVFAKTGTTRQAELARQIAIIPAIRGQSREQDDS